MGALRAPQPGAPAGVGGVPVGSAGQQAEGWGRRLQLAVRRAAPPRAALITPLPADDVRAEPGRAGPRGAAATLPAPRRAGRCAGGVLPCWGAPSPSGEVPAARGGSGRGAPGPGLASQRRGAPSSHPQPLQGPATCRQGAACRRPPLTPQPLSPSPSPPPARGQQPRVPAEPQCAWLRAAHDSAPGGCAGEGGGRDPGPAAGSRTVPPRLPALRPPGPRQRCQRCRRPVLSHSGGSRPAAGGGPRLPAPCSPTGRHPRGWQHPRVPGMGWGWPQPPQEPPLAAGP